MLVSGELIVLCSYCGNKATEKQFLKKNIDIFTGKTCRRLRDLMEPDFGCISLLLAVANNEL